MVKAVVITEQEVLVTLKKKQGDRTAKDFAAELGVTPQYLADVYAGRRAAAEKILSYLGFERAIIRTPRAA